MYETVRGAVRSAVRSPVSLELLPISRVSNMPESSRDTPIELESDQ